MKIPKGAHLTYRLGYLALTVLLLLVAGMASQAAFAATEKEGGLMVENERALRDSLTESLQAEVERVCKELGSTAPTVAVEADLSGLLKALPDKLSTSPTVMQHPLPPVAITAQDWSHLLTVFAKSGRRKRRIEASVGLSSQNDKINIDDVDVISHAEYGRARIIPAEAATSLSFQLCGVKAKCAQGRVYSVNLGKRQIGAIYEGDGELTLRPTCARSREMLADFVDPETETIASSRIFVACPDEATEPEPAALARLRRRLGALSPSTARKSEAKRDKPVREFLEVCVGAASPFRDEEALQGLAPHAGYQHPMVVVQTEEFGAFGFIFAGERGSETVMMTSPWTGAPVSYWESSGTHREWAIPNVERYHFQVTWHPERLRLAVNCSVAVSGLERGRDIRFILNCASKVHCCRINGQKSSFEQGKLALDDSISSALACGYHPMFIDGFLQISSPKTPIAGGEVDVSVEYSIDYKDSSVIETLAGGYFCEDGLSMDGHHQWFPFTGWKSEARWAGGMAFEIEVPAGFTAIAQGDPEPSEVKKDMTVWRYKAGFPTTLPSLSIGRYEQFADDEHEPHLVALVHSGGEVVGRRWLDAMSLVVAWAEKYCGKYPYKRFAIVQTQPQERNSTSWPTMLTMSYMANPTHLWWQLSHEVSHQWWGDAARMLDIDDVWLHEGTAVYFNMLFNEDLNMRKPGIGSFKGMAGWVRQFEAPGPISAGFRLGQRCGALLFSLKGAYLYHMLRMATNDDRHFFATLKQFQLQSQKTGLTEAGLKSLFEKAIGHDLSGLFTLYLHKSDLPGILIEVTDIKTKGDHAIISLSAQITPGGYQLPYPIDVLRKSGLAPHREVVFIGPDFGEYKFEVPFSDISRIVGNPDAMLLVAQPEQEDVELYTAPK